MKVVAALMPLVVASCKSCGLLVGLGDAPFALRASRALSIRCLSGALWRRCRKLEALLSISDSCGPISCTSLRLATLLFTCIALDGVSVAVRRAFAARSGSCEAFKILHKRVLAVDLLAGGRRFRLLNCRVDLALNRDCGAERRDFHGRRSQYHCGGRLPPPALGSGRAVRRQVGERSSAVDLGCHDKVVGRTDDSSTGA